MAGKVWRLPPPAPKFVPVPPKVDFVSTGAGAEVVRCIGADALIANIMMLPTIAMEAAAREMAVILDEIKRDSQENFVPIDTGDLHDSADSDAYDPGKNVNLVEMRVWYAAEGTAEQQAHGLTGKKHDPHKYAYRVHEELELNHPRGGQAKYLEVPFTNKIPEIEPRLAKAIGEALGVNDAFVSLGINDGTITVVEPREPEGQ